MQAAPPNPDVEMDVSHQGQSSVAQPRGSPRITTKFRCWCEADNVTFYARVVNISEGGIFLRTSTPLSRGARTRLRFEDAAPGVLEAEAVVVWSREDEERGIPGMGMKFDPIAPSSLDGVRKLISEQLGKK